VTQNKDHFRWVGIRGAVELFTIYREPCILQPGPASLPMTAEKAPHHGTIERFAHAAAKRLRRHFSTRWMTS
jgi:hypothetical protein